jgi:capsular polysaccharide biosynthesis protein
MSNPPPPATPDTDGEIQINLRQLAGYLDPIFRQWELLLFMALVATLIAIWSTLTTPTIYRTSVVIATTKLLSDVSLGSAIRTISESELPLQGSGLQNPATVNRAQRLQTFVALVSDASIAQSVYDQVAADFDPKDEMNAAKLAGVVEGSLVDDSDGIRIDVRYKDPDLAAKIANLWGEAYVRHINTIYSSGGATISLESVNNETVRAKGEYDSAQQALIDFITN